MVWKVDQIITRASEQLYKKIFFNVHLVFTLVMAECSIRALQIAFFLFVLRVTSTLDYLPLFLFTRYKYKYFDTLKYILFNVPILA